MVELLEVQQQEIVQRLVGFVHRVVTVEGDALHQAAQEVCGRRQRVSRRL